MNACFVGFLRWTMAGIMFRTCISQEIEQYIFQFMPNGIAKLHGMSDNDPGFNKDNAIFLDSFQGGVQLVIQFLVAWSHHVSSKANRGLKLYASGKSWYQLIPLSSVNG